MSALLYVPAIYCCIADDHRIKYPKQLFYLLKIWKLENSGWPQVGHLFLIHLLSSGVTGAGYPFLKCLIRLIHMSSFSVLFGLSLVPHGVSSRPPLPIHMALAAHMMVPSGKVYCFMKAGFQEWVLHTTGCRSCQSLKAWAPKLAECHCRHILSIRAAMEPA